MRDLNYQLKLLCQRNRDGSFGTQRDRERVLTLIADHRAVADQPLVVAVRARARTVWSVPS